MSDRTRRFSAFALILAGALALVLMPGKGLAQNTAAKSADTSSSKDRWLHVRVENPGNKEETVRVNVPLELAEKVLPTINHDRLHNGKVTVDKLGREDVDVRALVDAVRDFEGRRIRDRPEPRLRRSRRQAEQLLARPCQRQEARVEEFARRSKGSHEGSGRAFLGGQRRTGPGGGLARAGCPGRHRTGQREGRRKTPFASGWIPRTSATSRWARFRGDNSENERRRRCCCWQNWLWG